MSPRVHAKLDTRRAYNRYGRASEKGVSNVAGHAQSFRGGDSDTTDDGLEATASKLSERS